MKSKERKEKFYLLSLAHLPRHRPYYTNSSVGTMLFLKTRQKRWFIDRALTDPPVPGKYRAGVCIISFSIAFKRSKLYHNLSRGGRAETRTLFPLPNLPIDHKSIIKPCLVRFCPISAGSLPGDNLDRSQPGRKAVELPSRPFPSRTSSAKGSIINTTFYRRIIQ